MNQRTIGAGEKGPAVFYDQSGGARAFDELHLPRQAGGFGAYPAAKEKRAPRLARGVDERVVVVILTLLAAATKLYRIGRRNNVSWDEAHFGKFGAYYLNRTFYHDVHPPLAKMLVGLSELLAGHNGTFGFKGGETYPAYVNYTFMRVFNAGFGIALTPLAYITCRQLRVPVWFAVMAALFVTMDNAICVMSRFILLDAPLLAFTALALTMLARFHRVRNAPFSAEWWKRLMLTGLALGLVSSCKWVGLFAVALVGLYTIVELFEMYCNTRMAPGVYAKHWAARIAALIVVPLCVYALCFKVHFAVLDRYHNSASFMPVGFQTRLRGSPLARQPYEIHTGSAVRLQGSYPGTGYLHSHAHRYPAGSAGQQITGYGYADPNNIWNIQRRAAAGSTDNVADVLATSAPIEGPIGHGDVVALHHNATNSFLFTNLGHEAPASAGYREVSAVAADSVDALASGVLWVVEIVGAERSMRDGKLHPLGTPLRLRSTVGDCVLLSTSERLDKNWGWGQAEIACDSRTDDPRSSVRHLWTVERHINGNLPKVNVGRLMSSSFLRNFAVLNRQMWLTNNALVPDHDKHNVLESGPASWPFMVYPMRMVGWDDTGIKYLEIGNPLLWWGSATMCLVFPLQLLYWLLRWRRRSLRWHPARMREYLDGALILWGGWALHYLPFFLMGRVTYLHHYLPALYFGVLFLAYQISHLAAWYLHPTTAHNMLLTAVALVAITFWWFSPLTYGWDKPIKDLSGMEWVSSWPVYEDKLAL
ncbi:Protein O-mannosyltransferase 2 [Coemansia biformis]|uniref:Dolichyl-phosphate-mannose--protein mannosyltransferase n=1 Tax=Coemansia biformis TaxID=1286918 RepID=A0A9W7YD88_9FUNG|nr:Protein O-mannosyltransferase 2 [Coemansia biformis]